MDPVLSNTFAQSLYLLSVIFAINFCSGSHFRGGIIMWKPTSNDSDLNIEISFRISWRSDYNAQTKCTDDDIKSGRLIGINDNMKCMVGCSGSMKDMRYHCTDYSVTENWSAGYRSYNYLFPTTVDGVYQFGYTGTAWISLVHGGGSWELRATARLTRRTDNGRVNSSPESAMQPIVRIQSGCNHTITIPVTDADGDDVRCRWAKRTKSECGGICEAFPEGQLDEQTCSILYSESGGRSGWYAVAVQIEDFQTPTSSEALSSVPLQFLVNIFQSDNKCTSKPEFIQPTIADKACIGVPLHTVFSSQIVVRTGSDSISISEINTVSPAGMTKSAIEQYGNSSREWYTNITWSPTENQVGSHIFCFTARDSDSIPSDKRCISLLGGVAPPEIIANSQYPVGDIYPNHTEWRIDYDKEFVRPTRQTFIYFYDDAGDLIHQIDAATSQEISYPTETFDKSLKIRTGFSLLEKEHYYVLMDSGVACGKEYCGPESKPLKDARFWRVRIRDVTPPVLKFLNSPDVSNANVSVTWNFNEQISSVICTVQSPTDVHVSNCSYSWTGQFLDEGYYTLYIRATDLENNVALPVRHTLRVDRTPPVLTMLNIPRSPSNKSSQTFTFECNEACRVLCTYYQTGKISTLRMCSSAKYNKQKMFYTTGALLPDVQYVFAIQAIDEVENQGEVIHYSWKTDFQAPNLTGLTMKTIPCGSNVSPNVTGFPVVTDNLDLNPNVTYFDTSAGACGLSRTWLAIDNAGNTATETQQVRFTSPKQPTVIFPSNTIIACGELEWTTREVLIPSVQVIHPCGLPVNITYSDPSEANNCGITFSRTWLVTDDCGGRVSGTQSIQILELQVPQTPQIGQRNMDLQPLLQWPTYPGSVSYRVFLWPTEGRRPSLPASITTTSNFRPQNNLHPGTKMSWYIEYVLKDNITIPSPVWGFETRSYSDLAVDSIIVPPIAYSGQEFEVKWTVRNMGNLTTQVSFWRDAVYMSFTDDFSRAKLMEVVPITNILFPSDGYSTQATIQLLNSDIGQLYVFVKTDIYRNTKDIDISNNVRRSIGTVDVKLTPPPDLQVTDISFDQSAYSGTEISVRWTVTNKGTGVTSSAKWYDRIWWSSQPFLNSSRIVLSTVKHDGGLLPEEEYTMSQRITVPRYIYGDFYIIVQTDVYNNVFEHIRDGNNIMIAQNAIHVILTPPPDLAISNIHAANKFQTGDMAMIEWTVVNDGSSAPYQRYWEDRVTLVSPNTGIVTLLGITTFSGVFEPGNKYQRKINYRIEGNLPAGKYKLNLNIDYKSRVFEYQSKENNNRTLEIEIVQMLPDLILSHIRVNMSESNHSVNSIYCQWKGLNNGPGPVIAPEWTDQIFVIPMNGQFKEKVIYSLLYRNQDKMKKQLSYEPAVIGLVLPEDIYGDIKIKIMIDAYHQTADTTPGNNIGTTAQLAVPLRAADLEILALNIKSNNIYSGTLISIELTVTNKGTNISAEKHWIDKIILRPDALDEGIILAQQMSEQNGPLYNNINYTKLITLRIPESVVGESYIHCQINQNEALFEGHRLSNNVKIVPISILTPPSADLVVSNIEIQLSFDSNSNRLLFVKWTVTNNGNSMSYLQNWIDSIALAENPSQTDIKALDILTSYTISAELESGSAYTYSKTLILQRNLVGRFYVYVAADASNNVNEQNGEMNNIAFADELVILSAESQPKLKSVVEFLEDGNFNSGETIYVAYQVINTGKVSTKITSWMDGIYIYNQQTSNRNDILQNAIQLKLIPHIGVLHANDSYKVNSTVTIPYFILGDTYLYFIPDTEGSIISDGSTQMVQRTKLSVSIGDLPNLVPSMNISVKQIQGGQPFTFNYSVSNLGDQNVLHPSYDSIALSMDEALDPFDIKLGGKFSSYNIGVNDTIYTSMTVFLPFDLDIRSYFIILSIDSRNEIYESDENDNQVRVALTILEAVSSDLVVTDIMAPLSAKYGETIKVDWKLENNGSQKTNGYKCDTVYLSDDNLFDLNDNQIGDTVCGFIEINPYSSSKDVLSFTTNAEVPLIPPNEYMTIVKTRSNILDKNLKNNVGYAKQTTNVTMDAVELGNTTYFSFHADDMKAFKIPNVPLGKTLVISLTSGNKDTFSSMNVRFRKPATLYAFDATISNPYLPDQVLTIPNTKKGDYYILVHYTGSVLSTPPRSWQQQLHVKLAKFEILNSLPTKAAPLGNVTLKIEGTLIPQDVSVELFNNRRSKVSLQLYRISASLIFATFDLTSSLVGENCSLRLISKTLNKNVTLTNAIKIVDGLKGKAIAKLSIPSALRPGERDFISVDIQNIGDTDIIAPIISVSSKSVGHLKLITNTKQTDYLQRHLLLAGQDNGLGGILQPNGYSRFVFELKQIDESIIGNVEISVSVLPFDDLPHMYLFQKDILHLTHYGEESWNHIWNNFIELIGTTRQSLGWKLSEVSNQLSVSGHLVFEISDIISLLIDMADSPNINGNLESAVDVVEKSRIKDFVVNLELQRFFPTNIGARFSDGPMGYGWILPLWDTRVKNVSREVIRLTFEKSDYLFTILQFGIYGNDVLGQLVIRNSGMYLVTKDGQKEYRFNSTTGRLISVSSEQDGSSIKLVYEFDKIKKIQHSSGRFISIHYDTQNRIIVAELRSDRSTLIQRSAYRYSLESNHLTTVEIDGKFTHYEYFNDNSLKVVSRSDGDRLEMEYTAEGYLKSRQTVKYLNTTEKVVTADTMYFYDGAAKVKQLSVLDNITVTYTYDELGRIISAERPGFLTDRWVYVVDAKTVYQGDVIVIHENYIKNENLARLEDGNGDSVEFTYDDQGRVKTFKDGGGNKYSVQRQYNGSLESITFPDGSFERYSYHNNGHSVISRTGSVKIYEFNEEGRLMYKNIGVNDTITYGYNEYGYLTDATNNQGSVRVSYDEKALPESVIYDNYENSTYINYEFNNITNLKTRISTSSGYDVEYLYNENELLTEVKNKRDNTSLMTAEYTSEGKLRKKILGNGAQTTYHYNKDNGLLEALYNYGPNGSLISKFEYNYDLRQRRVFMKTVQGKWMFRYDTAGQVIYVQRPDGHVTEYGYDERKNRRYIIENNKRTDYTSTSLNQYRTFGDTSFEHDKNGNLIKKTGQNFREYKFDEENKLRRFATKDSDCEIFYDAMENLKSKICQQDRTEYLVDPFGRDGPDVIQQSTVDTDGNYRRTQFYYGGDQLGLIAMDNEDGLHYYQFDAVGSVISLIHNSGAIMNSYEYEPFGQLLSYSEKVKNPFRYIGQWGVVNFLEIDELHYMRARFYDASQGKFLSMDPIGISGRSKNFYTYVYNNPIQFIDPKGTNPAMLISAAVNVGAYVAVQYITGGDITLGGVAGAAITGALGGVLGSKVLAATESIGGRVLGFFGLNTVNAAVGSATQFVIDHVIGGKPVDYNGIKGSFLGAVANILVPPPLQASKAGSVIGQVGSFLLTPGSSIKEKMKQIEDTWKQRYADGKEYLNKMKDGVKQGWNNIKDFTKNEWNEAKNLAKNLKDSAIDGWENAKNELQQGIDNIKEKVKNKWNDAKEFASDVYNNLKDEVNHEWNKVTNEVNIDQYELITIRNQSI